MNFDTRTVIDIISLDNTMSSDLSKLIDAERALFNKSGNSSNNEFVVQIVPLIKSEIKLRLVPTLKSLGMPFLKKYIQTENVDMFQVIPTIATI